MSVRSVEDLGVRGKRVLVREDLNVPMNGGEIADSTRVDAAIPTLKLLLDRNARVVILSHLDRPGGKRVPELSLRPIARALSQRLGVDVTFAADCVGDDAQRGVNALGDGEAILLENVRFHPGEETNDPEFARQLAGLGDLYVNDAFGTAHRAHASTEGIAHLLPSAAGLLMEAELHALARITENPAKPFVCVIGGAKVKDKIGVFSHLMQHVDAFCIGGGMANTFLAAAGINVGKSLRDPDPLAAQFVLERAHIAHVELHLPKDAVVARALDAPEGAHVVGIGAVTDDDMILDIGPATAAAYAAAIEQARTVVFNGPMGVYERPEYRSGTQAVGEAIARATANGAISVVGGGDAAAAAHLLGFAGKMTHVSTGGGATLEFLEGKSLPGVAALPPA